MRALLRAPAVRVAFLTRLVAHSSSLLNFLAGKPVDLSRTTNTCIVLIHLHCTILLTENTYHRNMYLLQ